MYSPLFHPLSRTWVLGKLEKHQAVPLSKDEIESLADFLNGSAKVDTVIDLNRLATELQAVSDGGYAGVMNGCLVLDGAWKIEDLTSKLSGFTKVVAIPPCGEKCDQEVFDKGVGVLLSAVSKADADAWCSALSQATGWRIDWHYFAGHVRVLCLPPLPKIDKVGPVGKPATQLLMDEVQKE